MSTPNEEIDAKVEAVWRDVLTHMHSNKLAALPSNPRCATCHVPFGGVGGAIARMSGHRPSRKNPAFCNVCDDNLPHGGAEVDIAVLFADVRGSTTLAENMGATAFAGLLNRFYKAARDVLVARNAAIDKMIGDEMMAFFVPVSGPNYHLAAVEAAVELSVAVGNGTKEEPWLPLGIGVQAGTAFVGKVGSDGIHDFTALGDTVNTAARFQALAGPGEIVLGEELYQELADIHPNAQARTVQLQGKRDPVAIRVIQVGA